MSQAKTVSVIIPACNEAATIHDVITACKNIRPLEIIVVANGCTDGTEKIAARHGCKVLTYTLPLGHDVGRAVGAKEAQGEVLLFLDADFPISSVQLQTFIEPVVTGKADVVLNDLDALFHEEKRPHSITVWRQIANAFLRKEYLGIDSLLSVPHAMTRNVLQQIGTRSLANPILGHLRLATLPQIRIHHQNAVEVIKTNRFRPEEHQVHPVRLSRSEQRMIGDHLAALASVLPDERGGFSDGNRRRDIVAKLKSGQMKYPVISSKILNPHTRLYQGKSLSVIIPVQNEAPTLRQVIQEAKKIEPLEIIVVVNGSDDSSLSIALEEGTTVLYFKERLGNDTGRAIGAMAAQGDILLFVDSDFSVPATDLYLYGKAVANGVDLALNDLNHYLTLRYPYSLVTASKYGVNLALDRKDLGVGSLIAVPHAMSRNAVRTIGADTLLSPVKAQVRAILDGFSAACVCRTEVDLLNRIRPEEHFANKGYSPAVERIIGDHIEGIWYLVKMKGERGLFPDQRNYDVL
mgnify:CR=1 FL=1